MKLIALVGTNSKKSTNRQLLQYIQKHFEEKAEIELVEIKDLPMFVRNGEENVPAEVHEIAAKIEASDGVIIGTPEYDHAIPASLMSALAWLSYGISPLHNKPVMITGASYGTLGSSRAQAQLRIILDAPELKAAVMPSSEFLLAHSLQVFDADGELTDLKAVKQLDVLFDDFRLFVEMTKKLSASQQKLHSDAEAFNWDTVKF
jgi:NAD(P)H-dependent FMN reductase